MRQNTRYTIWIGVALVLLAAGGYATVFGWMVPKTASFAIPVRWRHLPLREPRTTVHDYLGEPARQQSDKDEWVSGSHDKEYTLKIYYLQDSVASSSSIYYRYSGRFITRSYLLDSSTIR